MAPEDNLDPKVESPSAGLYLVDPNPPGRGIIPTEDMFIYVKFTAEERNRGVKTLSESRDGEINFIATEVKYNSSFFFISEKQKI